VPRNSAKKPPTATSAAATQAAAAAAASDVHIGMLWRVLLKYGVPPKLVRVSVSSSPCTRPSTSSSASTVWSRRYSRSLGVKQGDLLGPELFDFYIAAVMETWRSSSSYELCVFRTRDDFQMTGRRFDAKGEQFTFGDSEYADDTGLAFCSRADVETQTPRVMVHFTKWGMEIHAGVLDPMVHSGLLDFDALEPIKGSKSEVLFCCKPLHLYSNPSTFDGADLSPILLPNHGFMLVVDRFPYLGDVIARDSSDTLAVDARVESGCKAFGLPLVRFVAASLPPRRST
jgi:hypothetical protein